MSRLSIRWRLALWYGAVLAAVVAGFGVAVYAMMRHELLVQLDASVSEEAVELEQEIGEKPADLLGQLERAFRLDEGYEFQVSRAGGPVIFRSARLGSHALPLPAVPRSLRSLDYESVPLPPRSVSLGALGRWRVSSRLVPGPDGPLVAQAAVSLASTDHELAELLAVLCVSGPLAVALALGGGYWLARKALEPVDRMAAEADQITATQLNRRLPVPNPDDELGRLARTLNGMIARLERSFDEIRRFSADAAHELRTPLTIMRTTAEVALAAPREPEHYRRVLEDLLEEVDRLSRLAEHLLFLCRGDAGLLPSVRKPVPLERVVHDVADHMRVLARDRGVALETGAIEPCQVAGDEDQLRRLLFNLLDNALKFTPAGGTVTIAGGRVDGRARLSVADTGVGIAPEHLPHVFERFYRVDPARGRDVDGTGLGLAIGRAIAQAHGGDLLIASTPGQGTRITLDLPADYTTSEPLR